MCGIAGRFHADVLPPDPAWHRRADALLAHRGPDGAGHHADAHCELLHRRLAIVDLSDTGRQPMANEDGSILVVYNGEIYNHRELRAQLESAGHRFHSSSDTEVFVHLYEEHGQEMLGRLRGMFAFALYDRPRRRLLLGRDRFGIKPLYYTVLGGQVVFASEIKALLALDGFRPSVDRQACYDFVGLGYVPEPATAFSEIRALPKGTSMLVDGRGLRLDEYHRIEVSPAAGLKLDGAARRASDALLSAVAAQSVADVPVAALLSGGIDSSLVVAAYSRAAEEAPRTFNVGFPDAAYDETPVARAVSERYHTRHQTVMFDPDAITPELVRDLLLHFDQPFADSSLIPTYWVSRAIRDSGIKCALSGDGGDEAFGGYVCFGLATHLSRLARLPSWIHHAAAFAGDGLAGWTDDFGRRIAKAARRAAEGRGHPAAMLAGLLAYQDEKQKRELMLPEARAGLLPAHRMLDGLGVAGNGSLEDLSRRMTGAMFSLVLPSDMLRKVDMMSMRASIEIRVPMLDEAVVDGGLELPHELKTDGRTGKLVLRALARQWLPEQVAAHRKQGFGIPLDEMATGRLHEMLADVLLGPQARIRGVLESRRVERWLVAFRGFREGVRDGDFSREGLYQRIFIVLALELWLSRHGLAW